jgi:hypothetical protein
MNTLFKITDQPTSATYCKARKKIVNNDAPKNNNVAVSKLDQGL